MSIVHRSVVTQKLKINKKINIKKMRILTASIIYKLYIFFLNAFLS